MHCACDSESDLSLEAIAFFMIQLQMCSVLTVHMFWAARRTLQSLWGPLFWSDVVVTSLARMGQAASAGRWGGGGGGVRSKWDKLLGLVRDGAIVVLSWTRGVM